MSKFDAGAAARLKKAHPLLQKLMNAAREKTAFTILDSQRGRAAQELAFRQKRSKAHFGQSAHNWAPAIALDVAPLPVNWKNIKPFADLAKIVLPLAKEMGIPIRWGGDWNMNGKTADERFIDMPHYELHPWRKFAKTAKPFEG
jgi:peptidoglycan L-alanyl-D-glutamate endopeptidase CwlK